MMFNAALLFTLLPALVSAHGYVETVTIDGKSYKGGAPGSGTPSAVREVSDNGPVQGTDNPDLSCGLNAKPASDVLDANAGSTIDFDWVAGGGQNWPHNTGPMLTYMASCGSTSCDKFDSSQAKWFKIQEVAKKDNGEWAQVDIKNRKPATVTIPKSLKAGNYLIRHEIIALHNAISKGGAEFYPSCTQLKVGGDGTASPSADELVSLPGAYSATDPGILVPDIYNGKSDNYVIPGPQIATLASGSGSSSDSDPTTSSAKPAGTDSSSTSTSRGSSGATSTKSASSPKPTKSASSSGSCKLKKNKKKTARDENLVAVHRPRHISRIMRGINLVGAHSH